MIVVSKKRLGLILSLIMLSIFTFLIAKENKLNVSETVPTVALPVSNKVIIVDAGHGVPDERSRK